MAADGQVVASFATSKAFTSLVYPSAEISNGTGYYTGGTVPGAGVGGLVDGADLSGATAVGTFTAPAATSAGGGASPTPGTLVTLGGLSGTARSTSRTAATGPIRSITPQSATASSTAPSSVDDAG